MWNSGLYEMTSYIGAWNVLGAMLGLIWIVMLGVATIAWLTLPSHQSNPRRPGGRITPGNDRLVHQGDD
jgi:hypothetical protein